MTTSGVSHSIDSLPPRWRLRRVMTQVEETVLEGGAAPSSPIRKVWAAGVVRNPWIGSDVKTPLIEDAAEVAPVLAETLSQRVLSATGGASGIEAFGKGAMIGSAGELEHGAALLHTPYFANLVREYLAGTTVIAFSDERVEAGTAITVPLGRKVDGPTRDWFQTVSARLPDAPRSDEIVLLVAASTGARPFARSGDRSTDPIVNRSTINGSNT